MLKVFITLEKKLSNHVIIMLKLDLKLYTRQNTKQGRALKILTPTNSSCKSKSRYWFRKFIAWNQTNY